MRRRPALFAALSACVPAAACAAEGDPVWMAGALGGVTAREGDGERPFGSLAITRRLDAGYLRLSVTRFDAAVRQVDVTLPSTYTIGFVSGGATFGSWFADGYLAAGVQRYRAVRTDLGARPVQGATRSAVLGAGGDGGYYHRLSSRWGLVPSASVQLIRSKALREQIGPAGPSEYETRETGATFGATLRADRYLGRDRVDLISVHLTRYVTTNASAALVSGTRGAISPTAQSSALSDGWLEAGATAAVRVGRGLYLDAALSRTTGAVAGDVTSAALGFRRVW